MLLGKGWHFFSRSDYICRIFLFEILLSETIYKVWLAICSSTKFISPWIANIFYIVVFPPLLLLYMLGHCGKMMAIIERFQAIPELRGREWLVIADDDTLLRYSWVLADLQNHCIQFSLSTCFCLRGVYTRFVLSVHSHASIQTDF